MNCDLSVLKAGLRQFGLNPADWIIEAKATLGGLTHFELHRQADGHALFEGWAESGRWISLGIASAIF